MQRGSAALVVLVILVSIITLGVLIYRNSISSPIGSSPVQLSKVFNSSKPNPSVIAEETKTYSVKNLGFEFKYQKDLEIKEDSETDFNKRGNGNFRKNFSSFVGYEPAKVLGAVVALDKRSSPIEKNDNFDSAPFSVWVFENPTNLTEQAWYGRYWYYPFIWGDFDWSTKNHIFPKDEATVSGQLAKFAIIYYQPEKPKILLLGNNGKMFLFKIFTESNANSIGEKILSSMKLQ